VKVNWDIVGIATSIACAVHCAVLPVMIGALPVFGVDVLENQTFEWAMIALAFVVGVYALVHGFRKHHRNSIPLKLFAVGFLLLIGKQILPIIETLLLIFAVGLIISAHYLNFQYCHRSKVCSSPHHKH
jgi:uncharacterized membrane protein YoaK (UPF0700 family)